MLRKSPGCITNQTIKQAIGIFQLSLKTEQYGGHLTVIQVNK